MADLLTYWRKVRKLPLKIVLQKIAIKLRSLIIYKLEKIRDKLRTSFIEGYKSSSPLMTRLVALNIPLVNKHDAETLALLCKYYLEHRFDLLG